LEPIERLKVLEAKARQRALGRVLRSYFEEFANEPMPEEFLSLLQALDEAEPGGQDEPNSNPS